jgi:hypothetical protein
MERTNHPTTVNTRDVNSLENVVQNNDNPLLNLNKIPKANTKILLWNIRGCVAKNPNHPKNMFLKSSNYDIILINEQ